MNKLLIKPLSEFTYEELNELKSLVNGNEFHKNWNERFSVHLEEVKSKSLKNKEYREAAKQREVEEYKYIKAFTRLLKPDMIVSFKGTKGSPFRMIVTINESTILGLVVNRHLTHGQMTLSGYSSENSISNLNGWKDANGKWVWRKDIIKLGKEILGE